MPSKDINVWITGHEICDTVGRSLAIGLDTQAKHVSEYRREDNNIAYGILRGTADIFRGSRRWYNVDNGFTNPGHYAGHYRISYRGTQPSYMVGIEADHPLKLKPFRRGNKIMICPPSQAVCQFFSIDPVRWLQEAVKKCFGRPYFIKSKDGHSPDFTDIGKVITFNSSMGWLALAEGIVVDSDRLHSVVGSYYATKSIDTYEEFIQIDREPLFRFMRANQWTLAEIEAGAAWETINRYQSISAGMLEKPSALKSLPTASAVIPNQIIQLNT